MLTTEFIEHVLATIPGKTVGLLGDLFLDRYLDIDPARDEPSVETGLTAFQVTRVRSYPGALGTVMNNLAALGLGHIFPITLVGDDGEGYELRQALAAMPVVDAGGLVVDATRRTPTYTKPMYGAKELNRLDIKNRTPTPAAVEDALLAKLEAAWPKVDALIVLDQVSEENCGVVTTRVRERVAELAGRDPGKFVLADSRERIGLFRNVCVKPNWNEACEHYRRQHPNSELLEGHPAYLIAQSTGREVYCTNGEHGIVIVHPHQGCKTAPAYPVTGPIDVCGAGDSTSAGITCAMVSGATHERAAAFGNLVASITVQQIGTTGTAPPDKVRARWKEVREKA